MNSSNTFSKSTIVYKTSLVVSGGMFNATIIHLGLNSRLPQGTLFIVFVTLEIELS